MIEQFMTNLPWILAALLGISEALAHVPALKSNSILQMITGFTRKAIQVVSKLAPKKEEPKKPADDEPDAQ